MLRQIRQWLNAATDVVLPRVCPVCHKALDDDEQWVCRHCLEQMPRTRFEELEFNAMEQLFAGRVPIERATAYFYYEKGSPYASILHDIKYRNVPRMGRWLATRAVRQMRDSAFFDGIDAIVPVPLHRSKLARRGYNQSEYLAMGISDATGVPLVNALTAVRSHTSQTRKGAVERWLNIQGNYQASSHASQLSGKHVLLVDDVVTTGATLIVCADALRATVPDVKLSLFTLAAARLD